MPDQVEAWKTQAGGPFLMLEREVEVWALGRDRFMVVAPGSEEVVVGFDPARERAHVLAGAG